jgi:hypothetical protein
MTLTGGAVMTMTIGQRYRCQNQDCHCEVVVIEGSMETGLNPRCCCGEEMKKLYKKPTFKKLHFEPVEIDDLVETKD